MDIHSKPHSGYKTPSEFSLSEREKIVQEYLCSNSTKRAIWKKYTGRKEEKGDLLSWIRQLGYSDKKPSFVSNSGQSSQKFMASGDTVNNDFDKMHLEKRIAQLEEALKTSQMQSLAYATMIELAEKKFNISIRKKYNTKVSK